MASNNDTTSGSTGAVVPYVSWVVAALSIMPPGFVAVGILTRRFCLARWHKPQHTNNPLSWKPLSLRLSTLLCLLGLIGSFIILLESASLAFGAERPATATTNSTSSTSTATSVDILVVRTDVLTSTPLLPFRAASITTTTSPSTGAPHPSQGWLATTDPVAADTTTASAPPPSQGWLTTTTVVPCESDPGCAGAPPPGVGWLAYGVDTHMSWEAEYFVGTFLPTLLASLFAIPWKILDHDTKSLEAFAILSRPGGGGPGADTMLLEYHGVSGLRRVLSPSSFSNHAPVAITTFLAYAAALLNPLAAEGVKLRLEGECLDDWKAHCTATLSASDTVIRITQVLLFLMGFAVFANVLLLGATWRERGYGVASDPRSILGIASLSLNPFLMRVMRMEQLDKEDGSFSSRKASWVLGTTRFRLGYVTVAPERQEYAILVDGEIAGQRVEDGVKEERSATQQMGGRKEHAHHSGRRRFGVSGLMPKMAGFGLFLAGLIFLVVWYRLQPNINTGFERFMDSQSDFGVRFLFTCFGVLVGFGWGSIFDEVTAMMPLWNMSRRSTSARSSIMMPLSPSPYVGLVLYLNRKQKLLALLSFTAILGDFLPIFLANVPFSNAITYTTYEACTWLSVAVLGFMLVVLGILAGAMLFRPTGQFSVDTKTLGGVLHLACRSRDFQKQLRGLSLAREEEVKHQVAALDTKYSISSMSGQDRGPCITVHG